MYNEKIYYIIFPNLREVVKGSFKLATACLLKLDIPVIIVDVDNLEVIGVNYQTNKTVTIKNVNQTLFYLDDGHRNWFVRK